MVYCIYIQICKQFAEEMGVREHELEVVKSQLHELQTVPRVQTEQLQALRLQVVEAKTALHAIKAEVHIITTSFA
jgi:hypothetical protein